MTSPEGNPIVRQERFDIASGAVLVAGAVLVVSSLVCVGLMEFILIEKWGASRITRPASPGLSAVPIQRSNILETARGQQLQEEERERLEQWEWVEKGKVARIPISEASAWLIHDSKQGEP